MQGPHPDTASDSEVTGRKESTADPEGGGVTQQRPSSIELASWLEARVERLADLWIHELRARDLGRDEAISDVVERFARMILGMMPVMIGPYREQILPLWDRSAELYGAIAGRRGLAAGEAIEELHVLRGLVIRELYRDPPEDCSGPLSLREFLRLNRSLDRAVSHASVGHTDALFFQFFEGDGNGSAVLSGEDVAMEASAQLAEIRDEARTIMEYAPWNVSARGPRN
ncbi:MAG: hypothetical protein OEN56_03385 [Gemmatimonadota bacterium]|nr:hypothetical protein [Gemmatimonadota bacterium]